jgi:hypothetical protein
MDKFVPAFGRGRSAAKRSANAARRLQGSQVDSLSSLGDRSRPRANPLYSTSRGPAFKPRHFSASSASIASFFSRFTRHTMPSKFRRNSLKTNDRVPSYSTHKSGCVHHDILCMTKPRASFVGRGFDLAIKDAISSLPLALLHSREFPGLPLTNHEPRIISHDLAFLLSSPEALRMARLMTSVLDKRNFFTPSAPCWAFVLIGRTVHG